MYACLSMEDELHDKQLDIKVWQDSEADIL